ncbi:MAG: hypothetical protein EP330_02510 [Deltaproteobacteria bacterium]|nr:MAG: hypothetical protein EP330_02510 [Deltaproteobacteria bacterium]
MLTGLREYLVGHGRLEVTWQLWAGMLLLVNGLAPLAFLDREGAVVLGTYLACIALGAALTRAQGFTRLVAAAHLPWLGLVVWLFPHLAEAPADGTHGQWLRMVLAMNLTALCLDLNDLRRYAMGERRPL